MRKNILFLTVFYVLIFFLSFCADALDVSAQCAVITESGTLVQLYEKEANTKMPMASTTKIMTALIVLENASLNDIFTVSLSASSVDGSQIGLLEGDNVSVKDLLYMLMLDSANDAAETLAENIAGSVSLFADMMNKRASEMGLTDTHFSNPHGLPDENHYTTARELAIISAEAMKNKTFREIVSSKSIRLDYHGLIITNSNKLLNTSENISGIKTGFTKKAGRCLVTSYDIDGVRVICVTLNAPDDWDDHRKMYNYLLTRVSSYTVVESNQYTVSIPVLGGTSSATAANRDQIYGAEIDNEKKIYTLVCVTPLCVHAPVRKGDPAGYVYKVCNGSVSEGYPLFFLDNIEVKSIKENKTAKFLFYFRQVLKILLS